MKPQYNDNCQWQLREEIARVLSHYNDGANIDIEHLQQMINLDAFLNETLRLLTTVPMNLRHVSRDFQLHRKRGDGLNGNDNTYFNKNSCIIRKEKTACEIVNEREHVTVPGNSIIVLDIFNMQRDITWWGANAQHFNSQRFLHQQKKQQSPAQSQHAKQRHSYSFLPFSKGLRTCIGQRYSLFMLKIFLVKLISNFEFQTEQKLEKLSFVEGISLKFRNANDIVFQIKNLEKP